MVNNSGNTWTYKTVYSAKYCSSCESLAKELAATKQKLEAAEQAIRESQEQEQVACIVSSNYCKCKSEKLYAKPVIMPQSAEQLHIKELREALQSVLVTFEIDIHDGFNETVVEALAKQPDTRALDKALLEAEIDVLNTWCHHEKHCMADPLYMLGIAEEKLAELNKE